MTSKILSDFIQKCSIAEGDIEESHYIWSISDCKEYLHELKNTGDISPSVASTIASFLEFCKKVENVDVTDYLFAIPDIEEQVEKFTKAGKDINLKINTSIQNIDKNLTKSPFLKSHEKCDHNVDMLFFGLLSYINADVKYVEKDMDAMFGVKNVKKVCEIILEAAAAFQRENTKWSYEKQQEFIFNLLMGFSAAEIILYYIKGEDKYRSCRILDGLQRISALIRLVLDHSFMIPTKPVSNTIEERDLISSYDFFNSPELANKLFQNARISIKIYEFESEADAVDFYISINKGCTHSEADINKALEYKATL